MKAEDEFLALYKEYEGLLREKGTDAKTYEETSPVGERLRFCRNTRNYLSHQNDAGFVHISQKQILFLSGIIDDLKMEGSPAKKYAKTVKTGCVSPADLCSEAALKMKKFKIPYIPVVENGACKGYVSIFDVSFAMASKKTAKISQVSLFGPVHEEDELREVDKLPADEPSVLCKKGVVTGVYFPKTFCIKIG